MVQRFPDVDILLFKTRPFKNPTSIHHLVTAFHIPAHNVFPSDGGAALQFTERAFKAGNRK